jgi:hypothetical protein
VSSSNVRSRPRSSLRWQSAERWNDQSRMRFR